MKRWHWELDDVFSAAEKCLSCEFMIIARRAEKNDLNLIMSILVFMWSLYCCLFLMWQLHLWALKLQLNTFKHYKIFDAFSSDTLPSNKLNLEITLVCVYIQILLIDINTLSNKQCTVVKDQFASLLSSSFSSNCV